jgi:hypothetical protein
MEPPTDRQPPAEAALPRGSSATTAAIPAISHRIISAEGNQTP